MIDKTGIVKVRVTAVDGKLLFEADEEHFSFPRMYINNMPVNNIIMIKGKELPELPADTGLYVIAFMRSGDRVRYIGRVKMSLDNQINIQIRDEYGTIMEERRRYFKVDSDLRCVISGYEREGTVYEFDSPILSRIKNVSIGGAFLEGTDPPFRKGDNLLLNFKVGGEVVGAVVTVLRIQLFSNGSLEGYGCQFSNVDQKMEGLLARLVYEIQLKARQEKLEKDFRKEEGIKRVKGT
ncbi:MAG: PilZ domain-containing protein [Ruminiclostridium sp.]|nr:PilZ domain-containing protein [Ruminiclostridium sp.]